MRILIDLKVAHADDRIVLDLFLGAAQNGPDARHDLLETERLGHVVVAANSQPHDLVLGIVAGGQIQHGCGDAFLPDTTGHGETIDVRKHHVQDDQIGLDFLDDFDGLGTRRRGVHLEACEMQGCHQQLADGRLVIDNDNGCFNRLAHGFKHHSLRWMFPERILNLVLTLQHGSRRTFPPNRLPMP